MTWVMCYLPPMEIMEIFRSAYIFVCSESYFSVREAFIELSTAKNQMISAELLITIALSIHAKNFTKQIV